MATLSSVVKRNVVDPRKEGYPCFGLWGSDGGNQVSVFRVFNSDFQIMSPPYGSTAQSTSNYQFGMSGDAMYAYSQSDAGSMYQTQSTLSTNGLTTTAANASLYAKDQFPVGAFSDCGPNGYMSGNSIYGSSTRYTGAGRYLIDQILPEGVRPRRYFCVNANSFWESQSLHNIESQKSSVTLNTYRTANTRTQSYGSACYNEKTKTLVTTHGDGTGTLDVNVFKSTVDLNSVASVVEFFAAATVTSCTISTTNSTDGAYDRPIVLGDNGNFMMGYRSGNSLIGYHVNIANIASPVVTTLNTVSGTTSYGMSTDVRCSTRLQTTWDGKWAIIYQSYHYYGNGVCAYIVSIEDPQRYFTLLNTDTTYGGAIMPIGKSKFMYVSPSNTDGDGLRLSAYDFTTTSKTGTADTVVGSLNSQSRNAAIVNGGALNPSFYTYALHGGYYSTCYPHIQTINWWPLNGKTSFEGAYK